MAEQINKGRLDELLGIQDGQTFEDYLNEATAPVENADSVISQTERMIQETKSKVDEIEGQFQQNLEVIEYGAFSKCSKLKSLILPDSLTEIQENAFNGSNRTLVVRCAKDNSYIRHYCRMNRVKCKDLEG